MNFDHYDPKNLPSLSPADEKKPLAYLYYAGRQELTDPAQRAAIQPGHPIAVEDAMYPEDVAAMILDPEKSKTGPRMGYCVLPNGIGYACINTPMPGLTMPVRDFHMKWVGEDPGFHYKLWYPGAHIIHYDQMAVEDCGWGMMDLFQGGRPPMSDYGLPENYHEINPYIARVMGRNARGRLEYEDINGRKGYSAVMHVVLGDGTHQWSFAWIGAHVKNGHLVDKRSEEERNPDYVEFVARQMCSHFLHENAQLSFLMAKLYPEYGGQIEPYHLPHVPEWIERQLDQPM